MTALLHPLAQYWRAGGPLLVPLALVCLAIWAYFVRSRDLLARILLDGGAVENVLENLSGTGSRDALAAAVAPMHGGIAAMIGAALRDIECGAAPMEAFSARAAECAAWTRRDFRLLAALTMVAPLIGLLGTVMGMIDTFQAVSSVSGPTGSRVAAGISRALVTTQFGLVIALPGMFGLARLERMFRTLEIRMAVCRAHAIGFLEGRTELTPS